MSLNTLSSGKKTGMYKEMDNRLIHGPDSEGSMATSLKFPLTIALKWTLRRVRRRQKKPLTQTVLRKVLGLL